MTHKTLQRILTSLSSINESANFIIFGSNNESYDDIINILEQNSERLQNDYKFKLNDKVIVEIYPDLETYHNNMWEGFVLGKDFQVNNQIIGNFDEKTNSIKIVSPFNPGSVHNFNTVVKTALHEFVHVLTMTKFKDENNEYSAESFMKVMWLHEGIAVYESEQYKDFMPTFNKIIKEKIPKFDDLNDMLLRYVVAWNFAEFMMQNYSRTELLDLIVKDEQPDELKRLESEWQIWLKEKYI